MERNRTCSGMTAKTSSRVASSSSWSSMRRFTDWRITLSEHAPYVTTCLSRPEARPNQYRRVRRRIPD